MPDRPEIKTRGPRRKAVVALIRDFGRPFTAEQLWRVCGTLPNAISRATLYRILRALRDEGAIRDIFLPHGQQVSIYTDSPIACIMECSSCGLYSTCPALTQKMAAAVSESAVAATQTAVFLRSPCLNISECSERPGRCQDFHSKV